MFSLQYQENILVPILIACLNTVHLPTPLNCDVQESTSASSYIFLISCSSPLQMTGRRYGSKVIVVAVSSTASVRCGCLITNAGGYEGRLANFFLHLVRMYNCQCVIVLCTLCSLQQEPRVVNYFLSGDPFDALTAIALGKSLRINWLHVVV